MAYDTILAAVDEERLLNLERDLIRIPSTNFQEHEIADYLANYLSDMGMDVEMMDVQSPLDPSLNSRQPIARLKGTGGGPTLMINGHMDPGVEMSGWTVDPYGAKYEDGWIWGMGAHDDKGGLASAIAGVDAIIRSGTRLKGDLVVTPVVGHKSGGAGTRALVKAGILADYCINMEHSANTVANVCVGVVMIRINVTAPELFFRYSDEARAAYINPVEQQMEILRRIGPSLVPIPEGGWLTFTPHADLPGFPTLTVDRIYKEHYYFPNLSGLSCRDCAMTFQLRTMPGQTIDSVRADVIRLLEGIKADFPAFNYDEPEIPAHIGWNQDPMECPRDHPLTQAMVEGQRLASGKEPQVGGVLRIGNVGDGNIMAMAGVPSIQYGPGDIRIYKEWPTADERVTLAELAEAARAVACATWKLCG